MKTKLLSLLAVLLCSQFVMGQFHLGIKGGTNIIKVDGRSFNDQFKYGYHLGGFMEIGLGHKWSLQPEVLFNQYTTTVDSNFNHIYENVFNPSYQRDVKLNYLSIPILLNYKLIGNIVSLQAGPQFGVLMSQNKTLLQNGGDAFSHGDLSLLGGVQLKLASFRITGRYAIGLNNINDIDNQDKWKSQGFQISIGLAIL
ncbi:MAG: PorT family protein [Bacteroidetes bacterium]|nr:PorT family protein [Bacteroidota bacterium]MBS1932073.1 PorT family protein [Bacteroidota bacterium]